MNVKSKTKNELAVSSNFNMQNLEMMVNFIVLMEIELVSFRERLV